MFQESSPKRGLDGRVEFGYHEQCNGYDLKRSLFIAPAQLCVNFEKPTALFKSSPKSEKQNVFGQMFDRGGIVQ